MSLESFLQQALSQQPLKGRLLIAFSGGLDSTVLLHLVAEANRQLVEPKIIVALHVNHQLSTYASEWVSHCQSFCAALEVEFVSESVTVQNSGKGIEAAARDARYKVFIKQLKQDDLLLVAHHANDQAETFLLRLMRGAGALGLSAMRLERALGAGKLWRPLLSFTRAELEYYANNKNLQWIEDESNISLDFDRNFLRHKIIPALLSRWPQTVKQLHATSARLEETQSLLSDLAAIDFQTLDIRAERYGQSIDYNACALLSAERITNMLRYWCEKEGFSTPSSDQLAQIHKQFFSTSLASSSALVSWSDCECRQFGGRFYLMPLLAVFTSPANYTIEGKAKKIKLGAAGELSIDNAVLEDKKISIRWRQGGERCTPIGRTHSQTVKKLLQENELETWLRDRVPLIYGGEQLIAVGDLWLCEEIYNYIDIANSEDEFLDESGLVKSETKKLVSNTVAKLVAKNVFTWSLQQ